ncbi:MAG: tRNA (adenosine(37)-N6)-threonylcarbamoyltransferase complex ATPase subunit type 1 TsaE [Prevotellaceae bacterium]|jgi:tRNA threonylcarbamoyladenosine biosynthesis protein TsaE|nr:tRNA (adenosine(37)-N6)-threonylcarbamoyltransferase complex ATPase subunit type 1 TsaE [Prevotellaceae bacterium]
MELLVINRLDELPAVARQLLPLIVQHEIVAFYGLMGAGKTTLIKALCEAMGVTNMVNSPTFALVNEYHVPASKPIYHFDFYRINKIEEVYDMGYEDYFYSGHLCLIEWPELVETLLPENTLRLRIEVSNDETRVVKSE